ncbi:probable L-type lectin-domain containing receptor kinase S.5 [Miscanthus floridulus]|uniref:probable L-type lectin-domain containing receptor kinase S.5 n=1 Tax=Miscanthus floridulus TaxID=154761 RepID=UPI00345A8B12
MRASSCCGFYNKGEALLVYEYMTNGSLDLFQKGSAQQQQQQDGDTSLRQWHTRYGIARDIATGLHYVHHEHEPMVLHRDIKANNIMLDSDFRARLGDFGIACTVAGNRSSVTGIAGTWGYIAPDYAMSYKATRQTDIYAFGVLVLEIVTGKKNRDMVDIPPDPDDDEHITDWIWRLHGEGKLLDAVDASVLVAAAGGGGDRQQDQDDGQRLLLLGLACTDPNLLDRPSMAQALQVITKVMPPPDVPPQKPAFVWPPRDWRSRNSVYSTAGSDWDRYGSLASTAEQAQVSMEQPSLEDTSRKTQSCFGEGETVHRADSAPGLVAGTECSMCMRHVVWS